MQDNKLYDLLLLWEKTNNGLQIFQDIFSSQLGTQKGMKGFSIRSNDGTSCTIFKNKVSGIYMFKDFKGSNKAMNALDYVMSSENLEFIPACKKLFNQYGLAANELQKFEPITKFSSEVSKKLGFWNVSYFTKIQNDKQFKRIVPFYTEILLKEYNFKQIKSYENVGKGKNDNLYHRTITATDDFPIYGYDYNQFAKLYQPVAPKGDKYLLKHGFIGEKQERIIYGWDRLFRIFNDKITAFNIEISACKDVFTKSKLIDQRDNYKLESVIIATGGSDGLNIASLGYDVIWFNSETEIITKEEYLKLVKIAKVVFYVPDLDETGVNQAVKMGMQCLGIKILWLPNQLLTQNKKDVADWVRLLQNEPLEKVKFLFSQMLSMALDFKFWDSSDKSVKLNPKKLIHFLKYKNFRLYKQEFKTSDTGKEDDGYFIQVENNLISKVFASDIKRTTTEWLDANYHHINVYNMVLRSPFYNQNSLKSLPVFEYKKTNCGIDFQYYFFNNNAVKVSKDKIEFLPFSTSLGVNIWQEEKINHHIKPVAPFFETYIDDLQRQRIKILDNSSNYLKVLINTSRIFWKKDADETGLDKNIFKINSDKLDDNENYLQDLHLQNKMYCVGYALHQYKSASKAYMLLGVDFAGGTSVKGSYGGTGKSFLQKSLFTMLNAVGIGGKTLKDDNFPMDGITPKTRFVLFDDLEAYQPMEYFYNMITDNMVANQKGGVKYNIPFDDSAKVGATTNYAPEMLSSTKRRSLVYYNSDYYHESTDDNNYPFSRKISDDFGGKNILTKEYAPEEWNLDFNFMLQCIQFYLQQSKKIEAPMDTLVNKNAMMRIGDAYAKFFKELFDENGNLNDWIEKSPVVASCKEDLGGKFISPQRFTENLTLYCKANIDNGWSLEIKKRKNSVGNSVTHFYINTTNKPVATDEEKPVATKMPTKSKEDLFSEKEEPETDLPF